MCQLVRIDALECGPPSVFTDQDRPGIFGEFRDESVGMGRDDHLGAFCSVRQETCEEGYGIWMKAELGLLNTHEWGRAWCQQEGQDRHESNCAVGKASRRYRGFQTGLMKVKLHRA